MTRQWIYVLLVTVVWVCLVAPSKVTAHDLTHENQATIIDKDGTISPRTNYHRADLVSREFKIAGYFKLFDEHGYVDNYMVQRLAAFLMAVREINNKTDGVADDILPDTKLLVALESPDYSLYGVEVAVADSLFAAFNDTGMKI